MVPTFEGHSSFPKTRLREIVMPPAAVIRVAAAFDEAGAVRAFISTLPFTLRSCAVNFWISEGPMDSVLETEPMGLRRETLSSRLLDE